ncbi:hypothetical protein M2351_004167 [Azospirillum canadense]|nr:hypothetical protein [Azospirillum canadense]
MPARRAAEQEHRADEARPQRDHLRRGKPVRRARMWGPNVQLSVPSPFRRIPRTARGHTCLTDGCGFAWGASDSSTLSQRLDPAGHPLLNGVVGTQGQGGIKLPGVFDGCEPRQTGRRGATKPCEASPRSTMPEVATPVISARDAKRLAPKGVAIEPGTRLSAATTRRCGHPFRHLVVKASQNHAALRHARLWSTDREKGNGRCEDTWPVREGETTPTPEEDGAACQAAGVLSRSAVRPLGSVSRRRRRKRPRPKRSRQAPARRHRILRIAPAVGALPAPA